MPQIVNAIYEKGILHTTVPLNLPDQTEVRIIIQKQSDPLMPSSERLKIREILISAGLILPKSRQDISDIHPLSSEQRENLAHVFSNNVILTSRISSVEVISAFCRRMRESDMSEFGLPPPVFLSADERLPIAARNEGFETDNPNFTP